MALIQERNIFLLSKTRNFTLIVRKENIYRTDLRMRLPSSFVRIRKIHFSPTFPFIPSTHLFREERTWLKNIRKKPLKSQEKNLAHSTIAKSEFFKNTQSMLQWWKRWMKRWVKFSQLSMKPGLQITPWSSSHRTTVGFPHPKVAQPATYPFGEAKDGFMRVEFANPGLSDIQV